MDQQKNPIIITKCGPKDSETFLDSLYVWLVPGIITSLFIFLCVMLIILIDNQIINSIGYIVMILGTIYIPYAMIYSRIINVKQNCIKFGKENIPEAILVPEAVSVDQLKK